MYSVEPLHKPVCEERGNKALAPNASAARASPQGVDYSAVLPPLTPMIWRVIKSAWPEARSTMAWAISSGLPAGSDCRGQDRYGGCHFSGAAVASLQGVHAVQSRPRAD
jgi:hypothetical protein